MEHATINARGQLTIPARLRRELNLRPGEVLEVDVDASGVLLRRYDPEHDPQDWEYHAALAPRGPSFGPPMTEAEFLGWVRACAAFGAGLSLEPALLSLVRSSLASP